MSSRLAWHLQGIPAWAPEVIQASKAEFVKVMDPPAANLFPNQKVVGRHYVPDQDAWAMVNQGAAGALTWYHACLAAYQRAPYVHAWEGPNEPPVASPEQRANLVAFTVEWAKLMHQNGRRCVGLNLSVGWPDVSCAPSLGLAIQACDYWGLHEYSQPSMQTAAEWFSLRHRKTVAELRAAGIAIPPLLITECGIDGGASNASPATAKPGQGWCAYTSPAGYLTQLQWYDGELQKDPYVAAAFIFTSGPSADWLTFDVHESLSRQLAEHISQEGTPPMSTPDPRHSNLLAYHLDSGGMIDGIQTVWVQNPQTRYRLAYAKLVSERESTGNREVTCRVLNAAGMQVAETVYLVYAYPNTDNWNAPGNPENRHPIPNTFPAHEGAIGPLGFCLRKSDGSPNSDILWGFGTPDRRHVCAEIVFQERSSETPPVIPPAPPPVTGEYQAQLDRMESKLDQLLAGATPPVIRPPIIIKPPIVDLVGQLARQSPDYGRRTSAIDSLVVHHTAGNPAATPQNIAAWIIKPEALGGRNYPGFPYHYLVMPDGTIYQCQTHETRTWHVGDDNDHCLGIALNGTYTSTTPPAAQLAATKALLAWLKETLGVTRVIGHRELSMDPEHPETICPGNTFLHGWKAQLE